jgi:type I restriction enzyme S subunit
MSGWRNCKLGDVLTLQRGFDLPASARHEGSVPVVSSSGITGFHNEAKVRGPGVVIGRYGTLGEVHFITADYWPLNTALYVKDFKGNEQRYCAYLLKTLGGAGSSTAAAVPGVNRNVLHALPVRCPDVCIQQRISFILGTYDDLIEINRRRIARLDDMARTLFEEWFVRFRFPGYEGYILVEQSNGPLPHGWEWRPLDEVCEQPNGIQTGPFGSQLHQSDYLDDGIPVVMPKNLVNLRVVENDIARISAEKADELGRHRMRLGDVVYGRRGDIGRRAYISLREEGWFCGTGCLRLRPDPKRVSSRYFFDALGQQVTLGIIQGRAQGATMPNLSAGVMAGVPVMVPPLVLQQHYERTAEPLAQLVANFEAANVSLARARDLLLPRLISGELSVSGAERELGTAA